MGAIGHRLHKAWASMKGIGLRLPARCAICRQWPAEPACETCIARFAPPRPRCLTCALPLQGAGLRCGECLRHPPPLQRCIAAVDYGWPWRSLIARLKFQDRPGWAKPLAWLMRSSACAAA